MVLAMSGIGYERCKVPVPARGTAGRIMCGGFAVHGVVSALRAVPRAIAGATSESPGAKRGHGVQHQ
jgi:hypothetical protein